MVISYPAPCSLVKVSWRPSAALDNPLQSKPAERANKPTAKRLLEKHCSELLHPTRPPTKSDSSYCRRHPTRAITGAFPRKGGARSLELLGTEQHHTHKIRLSAFSAFPNKRVEIIRYRSRCTTAYIPKPSHVLNCHTTSSCVGVSCD